MRITVGLAGISLAAVLSGCVTGSGGSGGQLDGDWQLVTQSDGRSMVDIPGPVTVDATIRRGSISGSTGCNRYAASYTVDGNALKINVGSMTLIGCPAPEADIETAYITNLGNVRTYTATSDTLTMYDSGGNGILVYAAIPPATLDGVTWHVTGYNNGTGAVTSVVIGSDPTAIFDRAGTVSGDGSCNTFSGPAIVDGPSIKIGPLASTRRACADEALNTQEMQYLAALERATTYAARGMKLELRDAGGALMAAFEQR
jgi:heat shock protein HslJ